MRTELPAERLHRRLGTGPETGNENEAEDCADSGDQSRSETALSRWLPQTQPADSAGWLKTIRADPKRSGVIALAVVGVVAVLVAVFASIRGQPSVMSAKLPPVQMVSSEVPNSPAQSPLDSALVVSVVGLVHKPGLVTLSPGARIADALGAAGGPLDGADLVGLNMARRVADGEQIVVGMAAGPGEPAAMGSSISAGAAASAAPTAGTAQAPAPSTDLNTASLEELDALPGVGPVTAAAIVAWRDTNGRFTSVDELGEVDGIGPVRLAKLRDLVHV